MKPNEIKLPNELDELLKEWARYFKDRHKYERCKSLEGRFNPHEPGSWDSGWGDPEAAPTYLPPVLVPRALRTHACVQGLPSKAQRWAVTLGYCYPGLDRYMVLKILRKYTGRRFTWKAFLEEVDMGRLRVWACIVDKNTALGLDRTTS